MLNFVCFICKESVFNILVSVLTRGVKVSRSESCVARKEKINILETELHGENICPGGGGVAKIIKVPCPQSPGAKDQMLNAVVFHWY